MAGGYGYPARGNAALTARLRLREALAPAVDEMCPSQEQRVRCTPLMTSGHRTIASCGQEAARVRKRIFADQDNATEVKLGRLDKIDVLCVAVAPPSERTEGQPGVDACRLPTTPSKVNSARSSTERQQVRNRGV